MGPQQAPGTPGTLLLPLGSVKSLCHTARTLGMPKLRHSVQNFLVVLFTSHNPNAVLSYVVTFFRIVPAHAGPAL